MDYVIIGHGAAGNAAAAALRTRDPAGRVLVFSEEPHPAYYRPLIPALMENGPEKDTLLREGLSVAPGVEVRLAQRVMALDAEAKTITLKSGEALTYDRLLLASGSSAIIPAIPGFEGAGSHVLRTLADAEAIRQEAQGGRAAVVIGGGRVGLKAALALGHRGLKVTVVEQASRVVPLQFDEVAGEIVGRALQAQGLRLICGQTVTEVRRAKDQVTGVILSGGEEMEAHLIVAAVGVKANVELAREAGLAVNQGVLVDGWLRTSSPDIFAAGDVVETMDLVTGQPMVSGLWTNAVEMGRTAGENMAGGQVEYPGAFAVLNSLELAGVPTVSIGLTDPPAGEGYQVHCVLRGNNYRKLVLKEGILLGALLVGDIEAAGVYTGLIKRQIFVEPFIAALMSPREGCACWLSGSLQGVAAPG